MFEVPPTNNNSSSTYGSSTYDEPPSYQTSYDQPQTNNKAIATFILGLASIVCIFLDYFAIIGIILGIIGIVLGRGLKKTGEYSTLAKVGYILSWIAIILCIIVFTLAILAVFISIPLIMMQ